LHPGKKFEVSSSSGTQWEPLDTSTVGEMEAFQHVLGVLLKIEMKEVVSWSRRDSDGVIWKMDELTNSRLRYSSISTILRSDRRRNAAVSQSGLQAKGKYGFRALSAAYSSSSN
jgi:hypothetical protein